MTIINSADLHGGIQALWTSSLLDAKFTAFWAVGDIGGFPILHDAEATPGNPFPYCVFNVLPATTTARMTGHDASEKHEIRDTPIQFLIYTENGSVLTAKRIAADLAEEVIKIFGGHPIVAPTDMTLDFGAVLINQYQNDFGLRTGDNEHLWTINYLARLDVPMMV